LFNTLGNIPIEFSLFQIGYGMRQLRRYLTLQAG
jgi:hypothetical protein